MASNASPSTLRAHRFPSRAPHTGLFITPALTPATSPISKNALDFRMVPNNNSSSTATPVPQGAVSITSPAGARGGLGSNAASLGGGLPIPRHHSDGVSVITPSLRGALSPGVQQEALAAAEEKANADRVHVKVEGFYEQDENGGLIPSEMPRSRILYVLTASDGRDMMFKAIQYILLLLICLLKKHHLFSPGAEPFLDAWALRFWYNYNTIRHARSLFKVGRWILNLFAAQSALERLAMVYRRPLERIRCGLVRVLLLPTAKALRIRIPKRFYIPTEDRARGGIGLYSELVSTVDTNSPTSVTSGMSFGEVHRHHFLRREEEENELAASQSIPRHPNSRHIAVDDESGFLTDLHPKRHYQTKPNLDIEDMLAGGIYSHVSKAEQVSPITGEAPGEIMAVSDFNPLQPPSSLPLRESGESFLAFPRGKPMVIGRDNLTSNVPQLLNSRPTPVAALNMSFSSPQLSVVRSSTSGSRAPSPLQEQLFGGEQADASAHSAEDLPESRTEVQDHEMPMASPHRSLHEPELPSPSSPTRDPPLLAQVTPRSSSFTEDDGDQRISRAEALALGSFPKIGLDPVPSGPTRHLSSMEKTLGPSDRPTLHGGPHAFFDEDEDDDPLPPPIARMDRRGTYAPDQLALRAAETHNASLASSGNHSNENSSRHPTRGEADEATTVGPSHLLPHGSRHSSSDEDDALFKPTTLVSVGNAQTEAEGVTDFTAPTASERYRVPKARPAPIVGKDAPYWNPPVSVIDRSDSSDYSLPESCKERTGDVPVFGAVASPIRSPYADPYAVQAGMRRRAALRLTPGPAAGPRLLLGSRSSESMTESTGGEYHLAMPASSALPTNCRRSPLEFRTALMVLFLIRSLAAAGRRILRDLTLICSERFFAIKGVEAHRYKIHNAINVMWFIASSIDLLLSTTRVLHSGWLQYAAARQNIHCRCRCKKFEGPSDLMYRHHGFVSRRKMNLVFPPLDMDYGAPVTSRIGFFEAADPASMKPCCESCGCVFEVPMQRVYASENPAHHTPTSAVGVGSPSNSVTAVNLPDAHRRSPVGVTSPPAVRSSGGSPVSRSNAGSPISRNFKRFEGLFATMAGEAAAKRNKSQGESAAAKKKDLGNSSTAMNPSSASVSVNSKPDPGRQVKKDEDVGLMLVPWVMRRLFNYAWLVTVHPNFSSTLLMHIRYIAEWYLAYQYTFGNFECHVRDAPLQQVLHPDGAIAGIIAALVVLTRVIKSAPS